MRSRHLQAVAVPTAVLGVLLTWSISEMTRERFNAVALLVAALCFYYLGGRFYSAFLSERVFRLDDRRPTPAHTQRDNRDFMPFRRWTLFGMHFAWIAGPGPLIGPTLAAQFGFLPGFLWIVLGAVLMGAVQDLTILVFSTRRGGLSLARMLKEEVNPFCGFIASLAVLFILEILVGVLALFVVNALQKSPWGAFTIACSIPIAFFSGWYMTRFRPGHEGQATAIGVALLLLATLGGRWVATTPALAAVFNRTPHELAVVIVIYGFLAAALPAWMLLAPRDNISTYMKIGTVALLAVGILFAQPKVNLPPVTRFVDGSGPVFGGGVFPFCFIIIACGAISGFHSLISSGTTPRFVDRETDMRTIGYGAMLTESFVGVMALIAAVTMVPGIYLAMNTPQRSGEGDAALVRRISSMGTAFTVSEAEMAATARQVGEQSLYHRTGGAPSLAVGMAHIFSRSLRGRFMDFWYHFAIMFEAVFILTVIDSGTRVIRFVVHEMLHDLRRMRAGPKSGDEAGPHAPLFVTSLLAVAGWAAILAWGVMNPEGGTRALIKMFGTANQLLSVIALSLATVIMLRRHRRYAWVTGLPLAGVAASTITASLLTIFSPDPRVGVRGVLAAAHAPADLFNAWLTGALTALLVLFALMVLLISVREMVAILGRPVLRMHEGSEVAP